VKQKIHKKKVENMELGEIIGGNKGRRAAEGHRKAGDKQVLRRISIAWQFPGDYRDRRRRLFMLNSFQQIPH